jgi:dihydropteroate synthase
VFSADHNRALVMGILNITPDSFSDGGQFYVDGKPDLDKVLNCAGRLIAEGADVLDIGGESTRPGASPISESEEIDRVVPVVAALASRFDTKLSVDTSTAAVIRDAAAEGAGMINDVRALRRPGALAAVAKSNLPVVLMHMLGDPETMQSAPDYNDIVSEVGDFLNKRVAVCEAAGIDRSKLIVDPGFGFGKTLEHNLSLYRALPSFVAMGLPVMVGLSRKRMIGQVLGKSVSNSVYGSVALALLAAQKGVSLIRVHDVGATVDALKMWASIKDR